MKDRNEELIKIARDGNRYTNDYNESKDRTLRQLHNARLRNTLYQEGYRLGVNGGNIDDVTDTFEIDGKVMKKNTDGSFKAGYSAGLNDLKAKIKNEEFHKTR